MADTITDNRIAVAVGNSGTPESETWEDLAGAASGTPDTEIKVEGSESMGDYITTTRGGLLFSAGSAQDWSNNVFYIWLNCGIVGLLDIKANLGVTIRFTGATVTDWFEVPVGGSDNWPTAVAGGWVMFVIDIEGARADAVAQGNTNGTTPATTAIQRVGFSAITASVMPRMADNLWIDAIWRLPDGNPGVIVQGRNGGSTDWDWADIVAAGDISDTTKAWGSVKGGPGGSVIVNTPIRFGANDATTHGFTDTNQIILWEDQEFAPTDLYGLTVIGGSGVQGFTAGNKVGSGDSATGNQGWVIAAAAVGVRFFIDCDDANIDAVNFYGCQFIHAGDFQIDNANIEMISCLLNDCLSMRQDNAFFSRNTIVNAATADGVAFITTDDMSDIKNCLFVFSDGHAIELTTPRVATQSSVGNLFTNYGADTTNDAAVYNNSAGAVTINVSGGGDGPSIRNGTSASTSVVNTVVLTVNVKDKDGVVIQNARVYIEDDGVPPTQLMNELTTAGGVASEDFTFSSDQPVVIRVRKGSSGDDPKYEPATSSQIIDSNGLNVTLTLDEDTVNNS